MACCVRPFPAIKRGRLCVFLLGACYVCVLTGGIGGCWAPDVQGVRLLTGRAFDVVLVLRALYWERPEMFGIRSWKSTSSVRDVGVLRVLFPTVLSAFVVFSAFVLFRTCLRL